MSYLIAPSKLGDKTVLKFSFRLSASLSAKSIFSFCPSINSLKSSLFILLHDLQASATRFHKTKCHGISGQERRAPGDKECFEFS